MNDIMSYQYPPPGTPPPPYHGYPLVPHMAGIGARSPDQPGRHSSPSLSFDLKRTNSHPTIKSDQAVEDSNMASAADKKRHKLNYQRASAACTNCRHRKIRCQAGSPSQGNSKCLVCHKLNKDCKFESINANSPTESRHVSISRASAVHRLVSASSSSSSPAISSGHAINIHAVPHHGPMTMPPIHQQPGQSEPPGLKMEPGMNSRYPAYDSQGIATNWMGPDSATSSSSRPKHGSWGTPYDTTPMTPMTPGFPPYTNAHHPLHSHSHSHQQPQHSSHAPPTPQQAWATTAGGEPAISAWASSSAYPPPTPVSFSPLASTYSTVDRGSGSKTSADMYPPIPSMDHHHSSSHHGGAALSPPSSATVYGGWQQPQQQQQQQQQQQHHSYPPIKTEGSGWYGAASEGGAAHGQVGMPVTDGYYAQR